jgi:hypothetical protein
MIRGSMAHAPMSQPARPTRVNRKAVFASGVARRRSEAMVMIAPAPTADTVDGRDDRLAATDHRLDQVTGHAGEVQQALHVHFRQRADDVVYIAAGTEIAPLGRNTTTFTSSA